jgi:hypothetical protein
MVALVLTQALISLHGSWRALIGWSAGLAGFFLVTPGQGLFSRVERGLVASAVAAIAVMGMLLLPLLTDCNDVGSETVTEEFRKAAASIEL